MFVYVFNVPGQQTLVFTPSFRKNDYCCVLGATAKHFCEHRVVLVVYGPQAVVNHSHSKIYTGTANIQRYILLRIQMLYTPAVAVRILTKTQQQHNTKKRTFC